jgi:hypothetical protein
MQSGKSTAFRTHPDHAPIATDSMVTVPLQSSPEGTDHDSRTFDILTTPLQEKCGKDMTPELEDVPGPGADTHERRASVSSMGSRRSRGTNNSESRYEEDGVDWEKLDKTEELEPRSGATDEVR